MHEVRGLYMLKSGRGRFWPKNLVWLFLAQNGSNEPARMLLALGITHNDWILQPLTDIFIII